MLVAVHRILHLFIRFLNYNVNITVDLIDEELIVLKLNKLANVIKC